MSQNTKLLHDFLHITHEAPTQIFLAHLAILAVKDVQSQVSSQLQMLQAQNTELTQQQYQLQQQHQKLKTEYAALQQQFEQQQAGMQQLSDSYGILLERNNNLNNASKVQPVKSEKDGVWTDPKTGLMWSRISDGQSWSNGQAKGQAKTFNWINATEACKNFHLAGFGD